MDSEVIWNFKKMTHLVNNIGLRWQISGMPVTRIFPHITACLYCTWFGRVALVSAARRAKSATFASLPKTGSPSPLSITLNPDVKLSWRRSWAELSWAELSWAVGGIDWPTLAWCQFCSTWSISVKIFNIEHNRFLTDPGVPGVRSMGPSMSVTHSNTFLKLNRVNSGWWRYQLNSNW